jgi:hypothetical protein
MSSLTAFASAARTATPTAYQFSPGRSKAVRVVIDTTAAGTSPTTVPTIEALDSATGKWVVLLTGAAITATGTVALEVGVGVTAVANLAAGKPLADTLRLNMTHGNSTSHTYTAGITLIR